MTQDEAQRRLDEFWQVHKSPLNEAERKELLELELQLSEAKKQQACNN